MTGYQTKKFVAHPFFGEHFVQLAHIRKCSHDDHVNASSDSQFENAADGSDPKTGSTDFPGQGGFPPEEFRIAHFRIEGELGSGGNGKVYKAFDESLGRYVAIKIIRPEISKDPKVAQSFLNEARAAAAINHPNVVQTHFVGHEEERLYIVMEWLQGRTLDEILQERGKLPETEVISIVLQAARGLQAGHQFGLIHGDIKPANLFLDERHGLKILDFGLASSIQDTGDRSQIPENQSYILGSPHYLPPERVTFSKEDQRSDIYSLGATLYHAISGQPPFDAENAAELAGKRVFEPAQPLVNLAPDISPFISAIVERMLETDPDHRQQNCDEVIQEWNEAQKKIMVAASGQNSRAEGTVSVDAGSVSATISKGAIRQNGILWGVGIVGLAALGLLFLLRSGPRKNVSSNQGVLNHAPAQIKEGGAQLIAPITEGADSWRRISLQDVGNTVAVDGIIVEVTDSKQRNYLHFSMPATDNRDLNLVVSDDDLPKFPGNLKKFYQTKRIRVTGVVKQSKGRPQIIVHGPDQIVVVTEK